MSVFGQGKPGVVSIGKHKGAKRNCSYKGTMMTYEMFELFLERDKIKREHAEQVARTIAKLKAIKAKIIKRAKEEGLDMSEFDVP